jgi:hypothetical protein
MATVSPAKLAFFNSVGSPLPVQTLAVTVTGENVWVTVSGPTPGPFDWTGTAAGGVLLNPPAPAPAPGTTHAVAGAPYKPPMSIPVTFSPASTAPVQAKMTINMVRNDAARSGVPGFPVTVALDGNVAGVGPGALKITQVSANPTGPDLAGEFVEIINVSDTKLDLQGCHVGDFRTRRGPRELFAFGSSFSLDPISSAGARRFLRIFTGPGVAPDPSFVQIPLKRGAPVWNNAGDTAWIRNPNGQLVDTFTYPPIGGTAPVTPGMPAITAIVSVAPNAGPGATGIGLVPTGITVEEGDRLVFSASGQIWVGFGVSGGDSGPDGRGSEPAGIGWPLPDALPISLIGRIGSSGPFFVVGPSLTLDVDDAEGQVFLGVNDINLGDNWGSGYTCIVTRFRPQ